MGSQGGDDGNAGASEEFPQVHMGIGVGSGELGVGSWERGAGSWERENEKW